MTEIKNDNIIFEGTLDDAIKDNKWQKLSEIDRAKLVPGVDYCFYCAMNGVLLPYEGLHKLAHLRIYRRIIRIKL